MCTARLGVFNNNNKNNMARPNKQGLDYFPLDVGIFEDEKMLAISGEFSLKGEIIVLRLLCEIYHNGYFVEYSQLFKNKLAKFSNVSAGLIDEIVRRLVKYAFFDGFLFREHNVLTSTHIQQVYLEASKRRKGDIPLQYWLLDTNQNEGENVNVNINRVNVCNNPPPNDINANINTTNKSKVNKSKTSFLKKEAKTREQKKEPPTEIFDEHLNADDNSGLNAFGEERKKVAPKKESAVTEECPPKLSDPIEIIEFDGEGNQVYPTTEKTPKKARFCKPTVEEIRGYCWERGNNVDAQKFFDYYESNGWKVGSNAMKDWKAAVRTWERNGFDNNNTQTQKANGSTNTNATNDNQPRYGRMSEETAIRSATGWA